MLKEEENKFSFKCCCIYGLTISHVLLLLVAVVLWQSMLELAHTTSHPKSY